MYSTVGRRARAGVQRERVAWRAAADTVTVQYSTVLRTLMSSLDRNYAMQKDA
jgi:hypothetical protein